MSLHFSVGKRKRCLDQPPSGSQVSSTRERPSIRPVLSVQDSRPLSAKALGPGKCSSCVAGPQGCPPGCLKATCLLASVPDGSASPSPCPCSRGVWDSPQTPCSPPSWNHAAFTERCENGHLSGSPSPSVASLLPAAPSAQEMVAGPRAPLRDTRTSTLRVHPCNLISRPTLALEPALGRSCDLLWPRGHQRT